MDVALFTTDEGRRRLAVEFLAHWIPRRRWFGGKARSVTAWRISHHAAVGESWLLAIEVSYADGAPETYAVPLRLTLEPEVPPDAVVAREGNVMLIDAVHDAAFRAALFKAMSGKRENELYGERGATMVAIFSGDEVPSSRVLGAAQSNTSLLYGDRIIVKFYRRLVAGVNPEAEITRFLTERAGFRNCPAFCGAIMWRGAALALAVEFTAHRCDGWDLALREAREFADGQVLSGEWLALVRLLGRRTGEMHRALVSAPTLPDFAPEPFTDADAAAHLGGVRQTAAAIRDLLCARLENLPLETRELANNVIRRLDVAITARTAAVHVRKCRVHGDYHLGQILFTGDDFVITDFEGEPARSLAERRAKHPPLRDVAGMLRSFHYAAHADRGGMSAGETWAARSQEAFIEGWRRAVAGSVIACDEATEHELLRLFLIEKALYEVAYELNNRPDWLAIPLRGVLALL